MYIYKINENFYKVKKYIHGMNDIISMVMISFV